MFSTKCTWKTIAQHAIKLEQIVLVYFVIMVGSVANNPPAKQEIQVWSLGQEDSLEKKMANHSRIFAWKTPWTEEPGRLQSTGSQKSWTQLSDWNNNKSSYKTKMQEKQIECLLNFLYFPNFYLCVWVFTMQPYCSRNSHETWLPELVLSWFLHFS